jgi:hypothetical protein
MAFCDSDNLPGAALPKRNKMNRSRFAALAFAALAVLLAMTACREPGGEAPAGSAKANDAYLAHFGEPPTPQQGTCYARVGYLPLAGEPERLRAVPLFIFREEGQLAHLLAALSSGEWDFPPHSRLRNPFPPGSTVRVTAREGDRVTIDLVVPGADPGSPAFQEMTAAVVETVLQFKEFNRVFINLAGVPLATMPAEGFRHDPGRIAPVGPPLPLMVGGNWEEGEEDPEEIFINFDRPVAIREIRLLDAAGREIPGEYFQTGFDMTVVLQPAAPHALREGIAIRAAWQVSDRLGRTGSGEQDFTLRRYEHEEGQSQPRPQSVF